MLSKTYTSLAQFPLKHFTLKSRSSFNLNSNFLCLSAFRVLKQSSIIGTHYFLFPQVLTPVRSLNILTYQNRYSHCSKMIVILLFHVFFNDCCFRSLRLFVTYFFKYTLIKYYVSYYHFKFSPIIIFTNHLINNYYSLSLIYLNFK